MPPNKNNIKHINSIFKQVYGQTHVWGNIWGSIFEADHNGFIHLDRKQTRQALRDKINLYEYKYGSYNKFNTTWIKKIKVKRVYAKKKEYYSICRTFYNK